MLDLVCYGGVADQVRFLWSAPGLEDGGGSMLEQALAGVENGPERLVEALATADHGTAMLASRELIQQVWLADGGIGPYPLLGRLAENQLDRIYYRFYRDHLVHQLRVWVLGLYLLGRVRRLRQALVQEAGTVTEALRRWKIASLWHDLGYVFEVQDAKRPSEAIKKALDPLNRLYRSPLPAVFHEGATRISEVDAGDWGVAANEAGCFVPGWQEIRDLDVLKRKAHKQLWQDLAHAGVTAELSADVESGGIREYFDLCERGRFSAGNEGRHGFVDHGVAGALLLLRLHRHLAQYAGAVSELLQQQGLASDDVAKAVKRLASRCETRQPAVLAAARAVVLHNIYPGLIDPGAAEANDLTPGSHKIRLQHQPLAYLLALCDALQDWDRPCYAAPRNAGELVATSQQI